VSTPEDDKFDFDDLKLTDDLGSLESFPDAGLEPLPETGFDSLLEPGTDQFTAEQSEATETTGEAAPEEDKKDQKKAKKKKKGKRAESDEVRLGEGGEAPAESKISVYIKSLKAADPFTVMLATAVVALLIAILCCLVELSRYHFDIGAKKARQTVSITVSLDSTHDVV
jgi:hypothetical protein